MQSNNMETMETMSCTEVSQPPMNNNYSNQSQNIVNKSLCTLPIVESYFESNHSCNIWEQEEKRMELHWRKESSTTSSAVLQRRISHHFLDDTTRFSNNIKLPLHNKLPCTYQVGYLIVFMCASATLLATGIWCFVKLPSSQLLQLKWNTLYTLLLWHSNIVAMVIGGFLCLWLLAMGIWLTNKSYKLWVKVSYWIWLFLTCGLATAFGILNCYILSRCSLSRWGEKMWKQMRADGMESILCSIQQHYRCQGWNSQVNETIPCSHNSTQSMPFCVNWIALSLQHYFLPQAFAFLLVSLMGWIELYSFIVVHKK